MTRINCVPPSELTDKHLIAEYRELPRIFRLARTCPEAPRRYTLGTGHMKFFYNKLNFLFKRQCLLVKEMRRRGFKVNYDPTDLPINYKHKAHLFGDWIPTEEAMRINRQRITERLSN